MSFLFLPWSCYDYSSCWIHNTGGRKPGSILPKAPPLLHHTSFLWPFLEAYGLEPKRLLSSRFLFVRNFAFENWPSASMVFSKPTILCYTTFLFAPA